MDAQSVKDSVGICQIKKISVRVLTLLFLNCTVWLAGSVLFMYLERPNEATHKCGVRRVRRDFLDILWHEAGSLEESEWKSLARNKLETFEEEIHTAVEAGLKSYSGSTVWTPSNSLLYTFTIATTIGYGSLTPSNPLVRLLSLAYAGIACPLFALLLGEISALILASAKKIFLVETISSSVSVRGAVAFLVFYGLVGSTVVAVLFQWNLQDSLYFVGSTITTIGFGDIVPEDALIYLCLCLYFITGLAVYGFYQEKMMESMTGLIDRWLLRTTRKPHQE